MSTAAATSPIGQAKAIRAEAGNAAEPRSREAQWAIGWALAEVDDALAEYARRVSDGADPEALEAAADEALERARALRNRLAEYGRREDAADAEGEAA